MTTSKALNPRRDRPSLKIWAKSRSTSLEVAQAIHEAAADHHLDPQAIFDLDPMAVLDHHGKKAVAVVMARAWELAGADVTELSWGGEVLRRHAGGQS